MASTGFGFTEHPFFSSVAMEGRLVVLKMLFKLYMLFSSILLVTTDIISNY